MVADRIAGTADRMGAMMPRAQSQRFVVTQYGAPPEPMTPGQVPGVTPIPGLFSLPAADPTPAALLDDRPVVTVEGVTRDLGLDPAQDNALRKYVQTIITADNEAVLRQQVVSYAMTAGFDPDTRRILLARVLKFYASKGKSQGKLAILKQAVRGLRNKPSGAEATMEKAGPFIGPKGGKWADAAHKVPWVDQAADLKPHGTMQPHEVLAELKAQDRAGKHGKEQDAAAYHVPEEEHVLVDVPVDHTLDHDVYDRDTGDSGGLDSRTGTHLGAHKKARVEDYAARTTKAPPIHLTYGARAQQKAHGQAGVMQGNHRLEAAKQRGDGTITAMMPRSHFEAWKAHREKRFVEGHAHWRDVELPAFRERDGLDKSQFDEDDTMQKSSGPFIGPNGGKWRDAKHTQHWTAEDERAHRGPNPHVQHVPWDSGTHDKPTNKPMPAGASHGTYATADKPGYATVVTDRAAADAWDKETRAAAEAADRSADIHRMVPRPVGVMHYPTKGETGSVPIASQHGLYTVHPETGVMPIVDRGWTQSRPGPRKRAWTVSHAPSGLRVKQTLTSREAAEALARHMAKHAPTAGASWVLGHTPAKEDPELQHIVTTRAAHLTQVKAEKDAKEAVSREASDRAYREAEAREKADEERLLVPTAAVDYAVTDAKAHAKDAPPAFRREHDNGVEFAAKIVADKQFRDPAFSDTRKQMATTDNMHGKGMVLAAHVAHLPEDEAHSWLTRMAQDKALGKPKGRGGHGGSAGEHFRNLKSNSPFWHGVYAFGHHLQVGVDPERRAGFNKDNKARLAAAHPGVVEQRLEAPAPERDPAHDYGFTPNTAEVVPAGDPGVNWGPDAATKDAWSREAQTALDNISEMHAAPPTFTIPEHPPEPVVVAMPTAADVAPTRAPRGKAAKAPAKQMDLFGKATAFHVDPLLALATVLSKAATPFLGPHGGKWANAAHTIPWSDKVHGEKASATPHAAFHPDIKALGEMTRTGRADPDLLARLHKLAQDPQHTQQVHEAAKHSLGNAKELHSAMEPNRDEVRVKYMQGGGPGAQTAMEDVALGQRSLDNLSGHLEKLTAATKPAAGARKPKAPKGQGDLFGGAAPAPAPKPAAKPKDTSQGDLFGGGTEKSARFVVGEEYLGKADPRGGKYHARVTDKESGKHRYFYDEGKFKQSGHAPVMGATAMRDKARKDIMDAVGGSREGVKPGDLKLDPRYPETLVTDLIKELTDGNHLNLSGDTLKRPGEPVTIRPETVRTSMG
jgi:hypothetical protein